MMLVGLLGKAGSGKSTAASFLCRELGFEEVSFAGPLKAVVAEMFGYDLERLNELAYKEEQDPELPAGWTRRRVLQHLGTEGFRAIDPDFWVKRALRDLPPFAVISDVRFANEAAAITQAGGFLVRIIRPGSAGTAPTHVSETEADSIMTQALVLNGSTRADFEREIRYQVERATVMCDAAGSIEGLAYHPTSGGTR